MNDQDKTYKRLWKEALSAANHWREMYNNLKSKELEIRAQAWAEGELAGRDHDAEGYNYIDGMRNVNPYRQGEEQ